MITRLRDCHIYHRTDAKPQALLEHNATRVYIATRSKERAEAAIADLKTTTGKEAIFLELDLADLASVRKAAKEFLRYAH